MAISELVNQIIEKRQEKLPVLEGKMTMLQNLEEAIASFNYFKSEIVDSSGNAVVGGKYDAIIAKNPEIVYSLNNISTEFCQLAINESKKTLGDAIRRFGRDRINISVVGKARIGKSRFLQSITNLNDKVIPAFSDSDCTGAISVIQNTPGTKLRAELTFRSETEMIKRVQDYLDKIISDENKKMIVRTLNDIHDLKIKDVKERISDGDTNSILLPYLEKIVDNFEEWVSCVREKETVLYDEDVIQTYVAQNNGKKKDDPARKNYYKYLAVKTCNIYCTFDYQEAGKITLLDTIGVSDNALGIDDEMMKAINDSDATVFMLLPYNLEGGGIPNEIVAIYNRIRKEFTNKNLGKWLFWLINYAQNYKTPNDIEYCKGALGTLENNTSWYGAMKKIIDVSDSKQVREEFLIPLLNSLLDNLDETDSLYLNDAQKSLEKVKQEYLSLCHCVQKVMQSEVAELSNNDIMNLIKTHSETIPMDIFELAVGEMLQKRDLPCDALKKDMEKIVASMKNSDLIPDKETIVRDLKYNQRQAESVLNNYCNHLRNELTKKITDVDLSLSRVVCDLKNKVTSVLVSEESGKLGRIKQPNEEKELYEWLYDFCEDNLNEAKYPNLHYAFNNLYNFDFSVKGFLTYEVRACLDELDSAISGTAQCYLPGGTAEPELADWVIYALKVKLKKVAELLERRMRELITRPNRAFFAAVREFSDQIRYAKGVKTEWESLLGEERRSMWNEEINKINADKETFKEWQSVLDRLLEYSKNSNRLLLS